MKNCYWVKLTDELNLISSGGIDNTWGVKKDNTSIVKLNSASTSSDEQWENMVELPDGLSVLDIDSASDGTVIAIGSNNKVFRYDWFKQAWVFIPISSTPGYTFEAIKVSVGSNSKVFFIGTGKGALYKYDNNGFAVLYHSTLDLVGLSASSDGILALLNKNGELYTAHADLNPNSICHISSSATYASARSASDIIFGLKDQPEQIFQYEGEEKSSPWGDRLEQVYDSDTQKFTYTPFGGSIVTMNVDVNGPLYMTILDENNERVIYQMIPIPSGTAPE